MKYILFFLCAFLLTCTDPTNNNLNIYPIQTIDLTGELDMEIKLSDIIDTLIYYPLPVQERSKVHKSWRKMHSRLMDSIILLLDAKCNVYDRENKTLIGSWGYPAKTLLDRNSSEIHAASCQLTLAHQNILIEGWEFKGSKLFHFVEFYNLYTGVKTHFTPLTLDNLGSYHAVFNDSLIISYRIQDRRQVNDLYLINKEGEVVKIFDSLQKPIVVYSVTSSNPSYMFQKDSIYRIYHNLNDTVYGITQQLDLVPLYFFNSGDKNISFDTRLKIWGLGSESTSELMNTYRLLERRYHCVDNVLETDHYLFAGFTHADRYTYILYDKLLQKTHLIPSCPLPDYLLQNSSLLENKNIPELHALENDLDGGLTFWPRDVTEDGDLLTVYDPADLRDKVLNTDVSTIKDPAAYYALREMITSLPDEDYYIVVQAKVKK